MQTFREFSKYEGAGNDFILTQDFDQSFPLELVAKYCHRTSGIGADGLILLQPSTVADFRMRIFNSDGTEANMCGNGLRCLAQYLADLGHLEPLYRIETGNGVLTVKRDREKIFTYLGPAKLLFWERRFPWQKKEYVGYGVDVGVPHLIFFEPVEDFLKIAKKLRMEENSNVSLAQVIGKNELSLSTYERGVEAVTLACGTGAAAAAFVAAKLLGWEGVIRVRPPSGQWIEVDLSEGLSVTGPVRRIFYGKIFS